MHKCHGVNNSQGIITMIVKKCLKYIITTDLRSKEE